MDAAAAIPLASSPPPGVPGSQDPVDPRVLLERASEEVRSGLAATVPGSGTDAPLFEVRGQLLRPLVAMALRPEPAGSRPAAFWSAALAIQLAHEASLLHDDVLDAAGTRRGETTLAAARGAAAALVEGDRLLTAGYRYAASTGSLDFAHCFSHAVERTVAGEIAQGRATGRMLDWGEYREIVLGKSGELLGCALATVPLLAGDPRALDVFALGRRIGLVYQMLDDLLDYCPSAGTGKPPLADYLQGHWTWVLAHVPALEFGRDVDEVLERLHGGPSGATPAEACLARYADEVVRLETDLHAALGPVPLLSALLHEWTCRARAAVAGERDAIRAARSDRTRLALRGRIPEAASVDPFFAKNSRSFHFAARLFGSEERARIADVYAFCRITDDLADQAVPGGIAAREALLDEWAGLARNAYLGEASGFATLDRTMHEMARRGIPFQYAAELVEGMRMDLRGERYETIEALRVYTYRVASVVGLWITELAGVREPLVLEKAAALGHAMQLTNILRDVGEDLRAGRLYLPAALLERHGLSESRIRSWMTASTPVDPPYRAVLEELMQVADQQYRLAFEAIPHLPAGYQRPVAVAARVYQGIHDRIRANGYDNLRTRARTSPVRKMRLAALALWDLREARVRFAEARAVEPALDGPIERTSRLASGA